MVLQNGCGEEVLPADDVGDVLEGIINDYGKGIGNVPVAPT